MVNPDRKIAPKRLTKGEFVVAVLVTSSYYKSRCFCLCDIILRLIFVN